MISRGNVIAALLLVELAIVGEAVVAITGGRLGPAFAFNASARTAASPRLVEGGPHRVFDAGAHPTLVVDIGYADLTIVASKSAEIDVGVSASNAYGPFRASDPITARKDGDAIRIATSNERKWSVGDDRMVTVLVPAETQVTVVKAGDIKANGLRAEATFKSVGRGTISIEDYDAPALHVVSSDGRIVLHQVIAAHLEATSTDDRVQGSALQVRDGTVESDDDVTLGFATGADTQVTAKTNDGDVSISGFATAASAGTDPKSSDNGDNHQSTRTVRVGAGDGSLNVHSNSGDITLVQEH